MNIRVFALIFLLLFLLPKFDSTVTTSSFLVLFCSSITLIFSVILLGDLKSYIQDYDSFYDLPPFVVLEAEHQSPQESKAKDCNIPDNKDSLPCLVLVEYIKEEPLMLVEYIKEEQEEPLMLVEYIKEEPLWLECSGDDGDGFRWYDSYEEDDDDEGEQELRRKLEEKRMFEEFIAKHYRKWREELVTDKLLYITAVIWLGDLKSYIQDYDLFYDLPPFVVLEAEHQSPRESKAKDCNIPDNKDSLPCLVLVEYIKEEPLMLVEYIKEEQEKPLMLVEYIKEEPLWLECSGDDGDGFRWYDSYEEDDDDDGEEELRRRLEEKRMFEEFIAKHYRKWREELVTDELLYITPAILLGRSKPSVQDFESSSYPPPLACEAECQLTENSKGEDDHNLRDNEDFLPRLVLPLLLEYFHDDGDGFHGCDGYKEDNEGDDTGVCGGVDGDDHVNEEEEEDEDFKRRIEEFIAKTNKIWREELLTDKLLCITTAYE
ncbi:hypothetical protein RHMOL_Rhmol07G0031200 [Rhododendron molle]|uniref:Uncharacterized protein n=1 Tax=Rhododendron molle TaxID=49168 RepID=A0ACC0MWA4_RHOML|nr:hypothetical protein RHMOL_Rhmol07G0031200 [Rhododendron molle]